jgi:pimeloyl-ACP methyl ester carboxylesterase
LSWGQIIACYRGHHGPRTRRKALRNIHHDSVLQVRDIGSMHVGGREATLDGLALQEIRFSPGNPPVSVDPNGEFEIEQMYVHYVRLASPRARHPLLLLHGGGLCGVTYETKPDGQPGWQNWFLRAGHDVYVTDAVERGRASWARSPQFFHGEALFRTKKEAWELFRIGAQGSWNGSARSSAAHPGTRFPVQAFDQFMKQTIPRWASTDGAVQAAYDTLAQAHGPFVVVAHSQGGNFAFNMALAHPDKIRAIVALEPSGFPEPALSALGTLAHIPHLLVWGDHMAGNSTWMRIRQGLAGYRDALLANGVSVQELDLPAMGIAGNSHMLMMDTNSDQVAGMIQQWIERQGLMR